MNSLHIKIKVFFPLAGIILAAFLYGCDVLEQDVTDDDQKVTIDGSQIYGLANNSTYIDLTSLVKTQEKVQFKVISQPKKGTLTEMGKGILQYAPAASFTKGKDWFHFTVSTSENKVLKTDSLVIVVESDSTKLPCGIYTQTDSVKATVTGPIFINVLKNDVICDTTKIKLEIYGGTPALHGTAVVTSTNWVKYTPNSSFTGTDMFFYRVTSTLDTSKHTFGKVYISPKPTPNSCTLLAKADYVKDSTSTAFLINALANDTLCDSVNVKIEIIAGSPSHGTATIVGNKIKYTPNSTFAGTDQINYKITSLTNPANTSSSSVYISIQAKPFALVNDHYTVLKDTLKSSTMYFTIFKNDTLSNDGSATLTSSITVQPHHGTPTLFSTATLKYVLNSAPAVLSDSLTYKVCRGSQCKTAKVYIKLN